MIVHDPYAAHIGRQLADAASEKLTTNNNRDTVRFEIAAYQMGLRGVARVMQRFHGAYLTGERVACVLKSAPF